MFRRRGGRNAGFTLLELMVVVLVVAILLAIAVPTLLGARTRAQDRRAQTTIAAAVSAATAELAAGASTSTLTAATLQSEVGVALVGPGQIGSGAVSIAAGSTWSAATRSESGRCFAAAVSGDGVVTYGGTNRAPCTAELGRAAVGAEFSAPLAGAVVIGLSRNPAGVAANGSSQVASVSADATAVTFYSAASDLVAGDTNGVNDVFVRDIETNATELISVGLGGLPADGGSINPFLTADERFVVFQSTATNLVAGDTNGQSDVFVRDRTTQTTVRASVGSGGTEGNGASLSHFTSPISADGRYLVFYSAATNLVAGDTNGSDDVFVRDLIAGTTERVSVTTAGVAVTGHSRVASISDDGSIVAFVTAANLSGSDPTMNDVYLRDRGAGTTTRLSYGAGFTQPNGNIFNPSMSGDGRFVTVRTSASNIVAGDTNGVDDIVVWSVDTGIPVLATVDAGGGPSNGSAAAPKLSPTGRYACFQSSASNLVPGDTNGSWDVFRRDLTTNTTIRVSLGGGLTQITGTSSLCTVTDNGSVGFTTLSSQVIEGDANGVEDVAVYLVL